MDESNNLKTRNALKWYLTSEQPPLWLELLYLLIKVATIIIVFVLVFTFVIGLIRFEESSMDPSIKNGDMVIYNRYTKSGYLPTDVIVLKFNNQMQIRRVIAVAGDIVNVTEEGLWVNGAQQQELEIYQKTERYAEGVDFPLTVPDGQVFVLGDSRVGAVDSRIYGCVKFEDTMGKVMTVVRRQSV